MTTELTPYQSQELVSGAHPLDQAIAIWLDAKRGRSGSSHTGKIYATTISSFRAQLQAAGLDLDASPRTIATAAQGWAGQGTIAPATYNRRLAVLSSFYTFARKRGLLPGENPIGLVERRKVEPYRNTRPPNRDKLRLDLAAIDRSTLAGLRDATALNVAIVTTRRVAELASLRRSHLERDGDRIRLTFERCKGGKTMYNQLDQRVSRLLDQYLRAVYGVPFDQLRPEAPIWVALSRNAPGRPPLSVRALEQIATDRLGMNFHKLRNAGAKAREDVGEPVSGIQALLGHASLATTGIYLHAMSSGDDDHAPAVAELLGLGA